MRNTLSALVRWSAISALWIVIVLLIIPTWLSVRLGGAGIEAIDRLKELADELSAWGLK